MAWHGMAWRGVAAILISPALCLLTHACNSLPCLPVPPSCSPLEGEVESAKERLARLRATAVRMEAMTARAGRLVQVRAGLLWSVAQHCLWFLAAEPAMPR